MLITEDNQGARVILAEVREENGDYVPISTNSTYNVAITSFLTLPGKSPVADMMKNRKVGITDYDAFVNYLHVKSPIFMKSQKRIWIKYKYSL